MPQVTMQDGTSVEFGERAKVLKRSEITSAGVLVKFLFKNGQIKTFEMPPSHPLLLRAAQHGLDQKFGDAFASLDDTDDMIEAFDAMAERLSAADWTEKRVSDGLAGLSVLAKALVAVTGKPVEEVKAKLKTLTAAQKTALRRQKAVAEKIAELEAGKEHKEDGDAVLAAIAG